MALSYLAQFGTERDRELAGRVLSDESTVHCVFNTHLRPMGYSVALEDCWSIEVGIGRLFLHVVDYGRAIHLDKDLQRRLNFGCATERNQGACLSTAAGFEWVMRNRPNHVPGAQRVGFLHLPSGLLS